MESPTLVVGVVQSAQECEDLCNQKYKIIMNKLDKRLMAWETFSEIKFCCTGEVYVNGKYVGTF